MRQKQSHEARLAYRRDWYRRTRPNEVLAFAHLEESDKEYIREHSENMRIAAIARYIGCTWEAVFYHIKKENLPKYKKQRL